MAVILFVAALGGLGWTYRTQARDLYELFQARFFPCGSPKTYAIGSVDARFGLSKDEFAAAVKDAEAIWEKPIGRDLFARKDDGAAVVVNLVYDYRQEDTDKLKKLGIALHDDAATYDDLKARHDALAKSVIPQKAAYDAAVSDFEARQAAYDAAVRSWNAKGGAPKAEYDRLNAERAALDATATSLNAQRDRLNAVIDEMNAMVTVINRIAKRLNLTAASYNGVAGDRGTEFEEGLFVGNDLAGTVTIYEFGDRAQLVRVLAHEMGHALGLEHLDDPSAVMYRLNQGENDKLSPADIDAVKALCRIK